MDSFKVKLVAYFLLLSLLPIVAAFWGFASVAGQSETRRVDARLQTELRSVLTSYQNRLDAAQREANALARAPVFQAELRRRDLPALVHLRRDAPNVSVTGVGGLAGRPAAGVRCDPAGRRRHPRRTGRHGDHRRPVRRIARHRAPFAARPCRPTTCS